MDLPELKQFLDELTAAEVDEYAKACGTSAAYLAQLKGGHRKASTKLARRLVEESRGRLRLESVRPDIWGQEQIAGSAFTSHHQNMGRVGNG